MNDPVSSPSPGGRLQHWLVFVLLSAPWTGCHRSGPSAATIAAESRTALGRAFAKASPELKALAAETAAGLDAAEPGRAFLQLNQLASRPDLTAEQRGAAAESMLAAGKRLQEAARRGDPDAARVLEAYRAGK